MVREHLSDTGIFRYQCHFLLQYIHKRHLAMPNKITRTSGTFSGLVGWEAMDEFSGAQERSQNL